MGNNWEESYLLNIKSIDEQHKVFFDLYNREINNIDTRDYKHLSGVIDSLINYLNIHFEYEEELLRKSNYTDIENHISQHKFFIQKVERFKQELSYSNSLLHTNVISFIKRWFLTHIIQSDREYQETVTKYLKDK